MKLKTITTLWLIVASILLLSSCAFNLFGDLEFQSLLSSGTDEQKLENAKNALSSKDYTKAIALSGSVLNNILGLNLTNEQLTSLLDSTSTLYEFAQSLYEKKDELNETAVEALKVLLEASASKSEKSVNEVIDDLSEVAEELGFNIGDYLPKSMKSSENLWEILESEAGTIVSSVASFMDNAELLKFLTSGYYALISTTDDASMIYAAFCAWYDICYMLNLVLDIDNDGVITDEDLVKNTITSPASFTEYASNTQSGLYHDENSCDEFVWAYDILTDILTTLDIDIDLPDAPATQDLYDAHYLPDLFELLSGDAE
ncbi:MULTISPECIES: outer membrane protein assembly factor BamD [Pseudothermotoga]|uniref:Lipoprotein n=3 Tax=Thermotogaceae TaxID=188709 RepID=A8F3T6_PSELT|nr:MULTISPECIES: hypothetical protein [Pseudothermotoga]ABV32820.1 hypothetical protein Tlet_0250 [Pseudothermotoga lettingae TMO]GLI48184.1 hypothetical protein PLETTINGATMO_03530 [Pseudothermotoga lettingae TMO]HBJ81778.1 hypothetical protein [Pseudothermotoga sp.]